MTDRDRPPEPVSDLEKEGIPDVEGAFPGEAATGLSWDGIVAPGDAPKAAEDFGTTAAEERLDEPLSRRVERETPDEAGAGQTTVDDIAAARRLVEAQQGPADDDEGDLVGGMASHDPGALSAEEAAVHVVDEEEAGGVSWDESPDYVGDEAPGGGADERRPGE